MTIADMFSGAETRTTDQMVYVCVSVHPIEGQQRNKLVLAKLVRERLLAILDEEQPSFEDDTELATRLKFPKSKDTIDQVAHEIRLHLAKLMEQIPERAMPATNIIGLTFASDLWDDGYFFDSTPWLVLRDERTVVPWEYVFGNAEGDLDGFSQRLTHLTQNGGQKDGTLVLDLAHLGEVEEISELFDDGDAEPIYTMAEATIGSLKPGDFYRIASDPDWVQIERVGRDREGNVILTHTDDDESSWDESAIVYRRQEVQE